MKTIIFAIALVGVMAVLVQINQPTVEYVREETTLEVVEELEVIESVDVITAAQKELERINAELDVKEQELLKEKADIEAELERLRKTRTSF
jgi:hypothetical protein